MDTDQVIGVVKQYLKKIEPHVPFEKAYLFGSRARGIEEETSDIDIAIFVHSIREDYLGTLKTLYRLRRDVDIRIEPHLFIDGRDPAGFSSEIEKHGIKIL